MSVVERLGGEDTGRENSVGKVAVASTIGATIEWYDLTSDVQGATLSMPRPSLKVCQRDLHRPDIPRLMPSLEPALDGR